PSSPGEDRFAKVCLWLHPGPKDLSKVLSLESDLHSEPPEDACRHAWRTASTSRSPPGCYASTEKPRRKSLPYFANSAVDPLSVGDMLREPEPLAAKCDSSAPTEGSCLPC